MWAYVLLYVLLSPAHKLSSLSAPHWPTCESISALTFFAPKQVSDMICRVTDFVIYYSARIFLAVSNACWLTCRWLFDELEVVALMQQTPRLLDFLWFSGYWFCCDFFHLNWSGWVWSACIERLASAWGVFPYSGLVWCIDQVSWVLNTWSTFLWSIHHLSEIWLMQLMYSKEVSTW
jgi:hypothetical protein